MKEATESPNKLLNQTNLPTTKAEEELSELIQSILELPNQLIDR